jgi:hypothetical protein
MKNTFKKIFVVLIIATSPIWVLPYMIGVMFFLWFGLAYYDLCKVFGVKQ